MKKLFWSILCIASLLASCSEIEIDVNAIEAGEDFTATVAETRAELDGVAVLWNEADELTIFTRTAHNRHYRVKSLSNGNRSATFGYVSYSGNDNTKISNNYAVYPYDADATLSGEVITTKLNAEQVYNAEKVDLANALMVAKSTSTALQFVNATSLMRFDVSNNMPDSYTLSSIKLVSAANKLAGEVTIDLSADSKAVVTESGLNEVTLSAINCEISAEKQSFYVALPATAFAAKDLTVTFTYAEGVEKSFQLPAFELELGSIKTIAYTINDGEDFEGSTPDSGEDFEGDTPGAGNANNVITYKAPAAARGNWNNSTFGAAILSHEFDAATMTGTITCDNAITTIGDQAFSCAELFDITLPNSVTSIGRLAFDNNYFTQFTIPDSVTTIGDSAFQSCGSLKSVTFGSGLTSVGVNPFSSCNNLTKFNGEFTDESGTYFIVDETLVSVAPGANISSQFTVPQGVTVVGASAVAGFSKIASAVIPDSVTTICAGAFGDNYNMESVTIGSGVKTIGESAFGHCALTTVTIPDSVTSIGEYAFRQCELTEVHIGRGVTFIGYEAFAYNNDLKYVYCNADVPPTAEDQIFGSYYSSKAIIYVPFGSVDAYSSTDPWYNYTIERRLLTTPANNEIWYTTYNNNVVTPKDVFNTSIKSNVYENGMGVITFEGNLTKIGYEAFKSCLTMENIVIPASVTLIDGDAFYGCKSLYNVYCTPTTPPDCRYGAFQTNAPFTTIYVPSESVNAYKSAGEYWSYYTSNISGYDF